MSENKCPVCWHSCISENAPNGADYLIVDCPQCGRYSVSSSEVVKLNRQEKANPELSFALRHRPTDLQDVTLTTGNADMFIQRVPIPTRLQEKLDLLILYLAQEVKNYTTSLIAENSYRFGIFTNSDLDLLFEFGEGKKDIYVDHFDFGGSVKLLSNGKLRAEEIQENMKTGNNVEEKKRKLASGSKVCFLVHGHDDVRKLEVTRFIEKDLEIEVIILHEQASGGKTIIEKIEHHSDVDFAVCLLTGDDVGSKKGKEIARDRARQNVILEAGFFMGRLGRERTILLREETVENPSDMNGIVYITFSEQWKDDLRKEIQFIYRNL